MFKKLVLSLVCLCAGVFLVSCGNKAKVITIIQYATHEALDKATTGIKEVLTEAGYNDGKEYVIKVRNPEADQKALSLIIEDAVDKSVMIFAIATPVAQQVANQCKKVGSNVPVFFTAVTDPVDSEIIEDSEKPGGNISGTNDMNPVAEQIALLKEVNPNATKIGLIYTSSEANSVVQINIAKAKANELGLTAIVKAITNVNELQLAAESLVNDGVDAIYLPTDNIIASNVPVVTNVTNLAKVLTICGETGMLNKGGTITYGIDYYRLGTLTGEMALKVLKGEAVVGDLAVESTDKIELAINTTHGISIPQSLLDRADLIVSE